LKTIVSTLLSVIIFTGHPLPPPLPLWVLKVHINSIYSYHRVQNSYQLFKKNHDLTLMLSSIIFTCHPFQPSSISLLRVGNTFSISSPFDVTELQKNCLDISLTGSFPFPMSMDMHILIPYQPYGDEDSTWI